MHFQKTFNSFRKDYLEKHIAISPLLDSAPAMAKPTVKPKQKYVRDRSAKSVKQVQKA